MGQIKNLEVVTDKLQFPEGPIAMADGSVLVVEIRRQTLSRVTADGAIQVVAEVGGGPNGAAIGPDGAVYICNNGGFEWHDVDGVTIPGHRPHDYVGGSIQRVDLHTGEVTTLYTECDGEPLLGPNDLVFDHTGGFYFSDHGKSTAHYREHGALYYAKADGSNIRKLVSNMLGPNGVGLSPDGKRLYAAETPTSRLWEYELHDHGVLAPPPSPFQAGRLVCTLPDYCLLDSLKVEQGGNIAVGTLIKGGVTVFGVDGSHDFIGFPDIGITNISFGGDDMCDVWATGSSTGKLYHCRWPRPGLPLAYSA
ncbi:SMP-30/gluconolactonase/LRE family protein [Halioxenophilus sp. WMMB6]|uniref:SMP-30/gluconolactonase/LRE family protein n=1 Tax=Halioxenophilus sp. WMMB6 TaxID=3073815 RepID=UPI00295E2308|nr:SMP-30/gluconolactonase/LRE family protein [Halioxenophilus sp. WMMB6]